MKLPSEVPVMTLPNATLFPQALLPLHIFEPRYRRMLADVLESDRMFTVAMQKPDCRRETPSPVAGLGLVRVSVDHGDGTSHLVLQGIARVELQEVVRYKPYRVHRIRLLKSALGNDVAVDALIAKVRELLEERIALGLPFPFPVMSGSKPAETAQAPATSSGAREILKCLDGLASSEHVADLVSCAVLADGVERQAILETVEVEARLRRLVHFLLAENRQQQRHGSV